MAKRMPQVKRRRNVPARSRPGGWILLAIAILVTAAFAWSLDSPFVFDDYASVVENPQIVDWSLARALTPPAETPLAGRPVVHLSFAANRAIGSLDPTGYRVVNLIVHILCAFLVFFLARNILGSDPAAFAASVLWALHPVNSEPVLYITQRTESMMALFYLATVYAAIRAHQSGRARWAVAAAGAGIMGAACKESIATAPLIVALADRIFFFGSFREAWRRRWPLYAGLAAAWLVLAWYLVAGGQTIAAGFSQARESPWNYLLNQTIMVVRYVRLAIWPDDLVVYYGWPRILTFADVWPFALLVLVLLAATVALLQSRARVGFWAAWFFITLAPTTTILPIATEVGAERRLYLPMVGLAMLLVIAASSVWKRMAEWRTVAFATAAMTAMFLVLAGALFARTVNRAAEYESPLGLAKTVLERWPSPNAHQMVGTELATLGRHEEAIGHLREAVKGYSPARYFLGSSLLRTGALDEGVDELRRFIAEEPDALAARGAHGMVASALASQERFADAIPHYGEYLKARPDDADAWNALGVAFAMTGAPTEAADAFGAATRLAPHRAELLLNWARALVADGRPDAARAAIDRAVQRDPSIRPAAEALRAQIGR